MRAAAKRIFLSTFLILSTSVHAKPNLAATLAPIPDIEEMLEEAGWVMTPEMSAKFSRPGDILDAKNTILVDGPDCFEAEVKEGAFAKMEVTRSMSAGVRLRVKVVGAQGNVVLEKKLIFDTPIYRQISRFKLVPTDQCIAFIRSAQQRGEDTSGWHVITESLSAIIQQQQCGKYDAKAGAFLVSTATDIVQACEQTSIEPVAVAYKTMPVRDILPLPATTATNTATTVENEAQQRPEIELLTYEMTCTDEVLHIDENCKVFDRISGVEAGILKGDSCHSYESRDVDLDGDGRMELVVEQSPNCHGGWREIIVFHLTERGTHEVLSAKMSTLTPIDWHRVGKQTHFSQTISNGRTVRYELVGGELVETEVVKKYSHNTTTKAPAALVGWWGYAVGSCRPLSFKIEDSTITWYVPEYGTGTILSVETVGSRHILETNLVGDGHFLSMWPADGDGDGTMAYGIGATSEASRKERCQARIWND